MKNELLILAVAALTIGAVTTINAGLRELIFTLTT